MSRILIVDDETNLRRILSVLLQADGHAVTEAVGRADAVALLASAPFDLVITDQRMPDGEGLDVLAAAREADPALPVVMLTAYATVELAVDAMRLGAFDVIAKPFVPDVVRAVVHRAVERTDLLRENERLKDVVRRLEADDGLLGTSGVMQVLRDRIAKVAPAGSSVLISGETGTGKELVARALHKGSARADQPFVAVNCAAFPESLLESELFGHERGAFTGADRARRGLFEAAHRGTLFLDEAGEMSLGLQAKLLRVLNDGQLIRVGSTTPRTVDVRIVVATHRDLQARIREGLFRDDLYYRIAVVPLAIPPLRERLEDLPILVDYLLKVVARDLKIQHRTVSPEAMAKLRRYTFPGNIRELRNLIERACILSSGEIIGPNDLLLTPDELGRAEEECPGPVETFVASLPETADLRMTLRSIELAMVERALGASGGVQAEAARRLGLSRSDLGYKLRKLGADPAAHEYPQR
ncbi:MAG: sigma-54-dependent Fis family transcriptional regulator [Blastocatellia bacterium]|nr:sigma-54-dependent Fis family transcriptional regulator [Blastocatellia bacterium]